MSELNEQKPPLKQNFGDLPFKHSGENQKGYGGEDSDASFTPLSPEKIGTSLVSIIATLKTVFDPNCLANFIRNPQLSEKLRRNLEEEADKITKAPNPYEEIKTYLFTSPLASQPGWRMSDEEEKTTPKDAAQETAEMLTRNFRDVLGIFLTPEEFDKRLEELSRNFP
jgi:hypothetical protein